MTPCFGRGVVILHNSIVVNTVPIIALFPLRVSVRPSGRESEWDAAVVGLQLSDLTDWGPALLLPVSLGLRWENWDGSPFCMSRRHDRSEESLCESFVVYRLTSENVGHVTVYTQKSELWIIPNPWCVCVCVCLIYLLVIAITVGDEK